MKTEKGSFRPALGAATMVSGILLKLAGLFAESARTRWVALSLGVALLAFGRKSKKGKAIPSQYKFDFAAFLRNAG